ncbi:MAG: hypothetical protein HND58_17395 [Planctomycetota bacterium]|nr:MAG: hypothetical protein HND58_17395 [Planctomycetota bacterium]
MRHSRFCIVLSLLALLLQFGCAAGSGGYPRASRYAAANIDKLDTMYYDPMVLEEYHQVRAAGPPEAAKAMRDEVVNGRMAFIDANYKAFTRQFIVEKNSLDTGTDAGVIGLNTAGALLNPTGTTQILSGIAAMLTGSKASFDKHFYYEQTALALYAAMNAQRKTCRATIEIGLSKSDAEYPLPKALSDLEDYEDAGTFPGGLQAIQRDASVKQSAAQERIDDISGLSDRVQSDLEVAREIIAANPTLARTRTLGWYAGLADGSADQLAARMGIVAVLPGAAPDELLTGGLPDPVKWLGGDPSVAQALRATDEQLARYIAGLNNPIGPQHAPFKGRLIPVLLGE